jgi:transposase-like protein
MSKYSYEFKLKAVKHYLSSPVGYRSIAAIHDIHWKHLSKWVALYNANGYRALQKRFSFYSSGFKLSVLQYKDKHQLSINEVAAHFNIPSQSSIIVWQRLYNEGGLTALEPKLKGRRPMRKQTDYQALLNKPIAELSREDLLKRLEYAEIENAYLKKLEALAQQKILASKNKPK